MSDVPDWALAARDSWQRRGSVRPSFAAVPGPGQVSVWDFPRPPKMAFDTREIVVRWGDVEVVRTSRAVLLLETSHPPTFYLPWSDVARHLLQPAAGALSDKIGRKPLMIGFATIGTSWITTKFAEAVSRVPGAELVVAYSRDAARADAFARQLGAASASADLAGLLASDEVDAVYIASPNSVHAEQALAALEAGKHVMVAGIEASNQGSIHLHEKLGFQETGTLGEVGTKFGRWLDLTFMQLILDDAVNPAD